MKKVFASFQAFGLAPPWRYFLETQYGSSTQKMAFQLYI
jgi:hypothetical protein